MGLMETKVTSVTHHTNTLFSFRTTRPNTFRFRSGEFVMIGLPNVGMPNNSKAQLLRAYSVASPVWEDHLEFYSIKVPNGPLTQHLANINEGDKVLVGDKPTGTLVYDALLPGRKLWLLSTGTGFAPFSSIIRDPEVYEKFDRVILVHGTRFMTEHDYVDMIVEGTGRLAHSYEWWKHEGQLRYVKSTTREEDYTTVYHKRITDMVEDGSIFWNENGGPDQQQFDPETDRVMICGSMAMTKDLASLCEGHGLKEGSLSQPGHFVIEKAFVS